MTPSPDDGIDWSKTTWKGSRREQHQRFYALPFARKLELIEEMCDEVARTIASRRRRGLPYIDPATGEVFQTTAEKPALTVNEPPRANADRSPGIVPRVEG